MAMTRRDDYEQIVAKMRALGVRRLRDADFEIELDDPPPPMSADGGSTGVDTDWKWDGTPLREPRRPRLKRLDP